MPHFRRVLAAEVVSNFGSMLTRLVIPWIATLSLRATPLEMGLLAVADLIAGASGALLLGAWVDRLSTRRVMIAADLMRALLVGLLGLAAWYGRITMAMLVFAAAASGLATMAFELARSAWIARRIPADQLARRNAQLSAAGSVTESVSFGIGGWIYQALGGALSLIGDAASYLASALFLARVDDAAAIRGGPVPAAAGILAQARAGLEALLAEPTLRTLAHVHALVTFGVALGSTSYMIYVARDLAIAPGILGMIFAVGGIGAALGAGCAPWLGRRLGSRRALVGGLAMFALGALLIPLAQGAAGLAIVLLVGHQLLGDAGYVVHEIHDRTLRQSLAPVDRLARVDAGIRTVGQLAMLAGALGGGALATALGARAALFLAAGIFLMAALAACAALARARITAD